MKLRDLLSIMSKISEDKGISTPFICGGAPRDKVMNKLNNLEDIDITTGDSTIHNLAKELSIYLQKNYNVNYKTMDDGHSSIFFGGFKIDFSSNFNAPDIENQLKKIGIKNPTPMQKEIYSRDFTCNAMLMSFDLKNIIDPTNKGVVDIKNKVLRTCLDPNITLTTNKNRVARAIYLSAKLDFDLSPDLMEYIKKNPKLIQFSSQKSLSDKLNKAINLNPNQTTYLLDELGLWDYIPITKEILPYYKKRKIK